MKKQFFAFLFTLTLVAANKPFVTTDFQGQLGNQLFQTAVAIAYGRDHDCDVRFPTLINTINGPLNCRDVFHRLNLSPFPEKTQFTYYYDLQYPENYYFKPIETNTAENICFRGYFPSEKFFAHHKDYLLELFAPTEDILALITEKYEELLQWPTVAIHVRTNLPDGHDPNNGLTRTHWGYFIRAIELFPEDSNFLIFADDYEWVKARFPKIRPNMHFINGNLHTTDFYLMSLCDHQVVSPKSTYSWWAAWLNKNPNKIVIAAELTDEWLHDGAYPESWILIPTHQ